MENIIVPISFFTPIKRDNFFANIIEHWSTLTGDEAVIEESTPRGHRVQMRPYHACCKEIILKIALISTIVYPIFMIFSKIYLRRNQYFYRNEVSVSQKTIIKLKEVLPRVLDMHLEPKIKWFQSRNANKVFEHTEIDGVVFKMVRSEYDSTSSIRNRYQNMQRARTICRKYDLNQLVIPQAAWISIKVNGRTHQIIVEEKLQFNSDPSVQERMYRESALEIDTAIKQLFTFIKLTGYSDVALRNNPILDPPSINGHKLIGLIDLEDLRCSGQGCLGLIQCLSDRRQIEWVVTQSKLNKIHFPKSHKTLEETRDARIKEIKLDDQLEQFYQEQGIDSANSHLPVQIDIDILRLSPKLKKAAKEIIDMINQQIIKAPNTASIKSQRTITICLTKINHLQNFVFSDNPSIDHIKRIVQALIQYKCIFRHINTTGDYLILQA